MTEKHPRERSLLAKLGDAPIAPPWQWGEVGLAFLVLMIAVLLMGATITTIIDQRPSPNSRSFAVGWGISLLIVAAFIAVRWRRLPAHWQALQAHEGRWHPLLALMMGIGGGFMGAVVAGLGSGTFIAPLPVLGVVGTFGGWLIAVLLVLVAQPLAEGLVFWAIALPRARASLGAWLGMSATLIVYALYYYLVFGARATGTIAIWYGVVYPLVVGGILAAVRVWSQSARSAILAQMGVGVSILLALMVISVS